MLSIQPVPEFDIERYAMMLLRTTLGLSIYEVRWPSEIGSDRCRMLTNSWCPIIVSRKVN
jgi:hypothetical protein